MFDPVAYKTFWLFVHKRQEVFYRRSILKEPGPWTDDPVLQSHKIINIYRELDTGTKFAVEHILEDTRFTVEQVTSLVLVYRFFNRISTYLELEPLLWLWWTESVRHDDLKAVIHEWLKESLDNGFPIYTGAYMSTGFKKTDGCSALTAVNTIVDLMNLSLKGTTHKEVSHELLKVNNLGKFLAHQLPTDLTYPLLRLSGRAILPSGGGWCFLGPGAKNALRDLGVPRDQYYPAVQHLWHNQVAELQLIEQMIGKPMRWLRDWQGHRYGISMSNMEGCLCEFARYWRALGSKGGGGWKPRDLTEPKLWTSTYDSLPCYGKWLEIDEPSEVIIW